MLASKAHYKKYKGQAKNKLNMNFMDFLGESVIFPPVPRKWRKNGIFIRLRSP